MSSDLETTSNGTPVSPPPQPNTASPRTAPLWLAVLSLAIGAAGLLIGAASFYQLVVQTAELQAAFEEVDYRLSNVEFDTSVNESDIEDLSAYTVDLRDWAAVASDAVVDCVNEYMDAASVSPNYYSYYYCVAPGSYAP